MSRIRSVGSPHRWSPTCPHRRPDLRHRHGPRPGESPDEWWTNTGFRSGPIQAAKDGGLTGSGRRCYFHDVPKDLADQIPGREPPPPSNSSYYEPWPLDTYPAVPTRYIVCTEDRLFPAAFQRELVHDRLGITADEITSSHSPALSHPTELAAMLNDASIHQLGDTPP